MVYKKILKHGNSLAIVIPREWCRKMDHKLGDWVAIFVRDNDSIVITRTTPMKKNALRKKLR